MDDNSIIELFWQRDERAIAETSQRYGKYCYSIAYGILGNSEDAKECVNDTYHDAWRSIPPHRPSCLSAFLGKLTRRIAIDKYRRMTAEKRGGGEMPLVLDELLDCTAGGDGIEDEMEREHLSKVIARFVAALPREEKKVFLCRYWYMEAVEAIGKRLGFSESKVKVMLYRTRGKLRSVLEKEGLL